MTRLGVKEALIFAALAVHAPRYWTRLQDAAHGSGAAGVLAYCGLFALLTWALVAASRAKSGAARVAWGALLAISMTFLEAQRAVMGERLEYGTFVGLLNSTDSTGDALRQFLPQVALAAADGLLLFLGVALKPRRSAPGPLAPAAPALGIFALAAVCVLRGGGGAGGLPSPFIPLAYATLYSGERLVEGASARRPVAIPLAEKPRYKDIVLLVDESVRGDYLDVDWPGGARSGLAAKGPPAIANFGLAASITNCSEGSNLGLRFGGTRDNYREARASLPSIWQYAKKAGFRTVYIDAQRAGGVLANGMFRAETKDIDQLTQFDGVPVVERDMAAEKLVAELVKRPEPQFIYVNKVGAHYPVSDKFPDAFARYAPMLPRDSSAAGVTDANTLHRPATDWSLYKNSYKNALLWSVGEFFDRLRKDMDFSRTLVLYTSDHGQNFHERGDGALNTHCSTMPSIEEGLVPLAVLVGKADSRRWEAAARANFNASSHYEIFPTLLEAMGYDAAAVKGKYGPPLTEKLSDPFTFNARFEARFGASPVWVKIDLKKVIGPS